ncbi:MAG: class II fumarate hydratase [Pseudomonadota bacterium]
MDTRMESDSFGAVTVSSTHLWGAQTQRALEHFRISGERMPPELLHALAEVKRACAATNLELGLLPKEKGTALLAAADEILAGLHPEEFPLVIWQTGSGTQTNMNMNEVLANRASELMGGERGLKRLVHPNDDANLGQSSNDVFPTAMHVAAAFGIHFRLLPSLNTLREAMAGKAAEYSGLIKIGRTHLQDAVPMTLGQEFSGYVAQLVHAEAAIEKSLTPLYELAIGGTAVGTGLNTHPEFGQGVVQRLSERTGLPFLKARNPFAALASHDALIHAHGALKTLSVALIKIANDLRWMASGPRAGLGEIRLPENEPGSSIMPGKINPTQCEALTMLCAQVIGNDTAMTFGGSAGNFELNVYKPLIAHNMLQSIRLLADGMRSFTHYCIVGIEADPERLADLTQRSLMLVTALVPHIGYDRAAEIAKLAHHEKCTLKQAALALAYVTEEEFDRWVIPADMTHPTPQVLD